MTNSMGNSRVAIIASTISILTVAIATAENYNRAVALLAVVNSIAIAMTFYAIAVPAVLVCTNRISSRKITGGQ